MIKNFQILPRRMEDFDLLTCPKPRPEGCKVERLIEWVNQPDEHLFALRDTKLDEAKLRVVGFFAVEFRIKANIGRALPCGDGLFQRLRILYDVHVKPLEFRG